MDEIEEIDDRQERREPRRYRGSLFGPLILIAIGALFLLSNAGLIPGSPWEIFARYWPVILIVASLDGLLRGEGLVGSLFMLAVGIVFLLTNLGLLALDIWRIVFRLWPLLLVSVGLDLLIGRRSRIGALLSAVVLLAVFFGALWFMGASLPTGRALEGEQIEQALDGAQEARIDMDINTGSLNVSALAGADNLIAGTVQTRASREVRQDYSLQGSTAVYTLDEVGGFGFFGLESDARWELELAQNVPLDLDVSLGAGEMVLDLTDLMVNSLDVNIGAGELRLTLPAEAGFEGEVSGAVGSIVILTAPGTGLRLQSGTAISAVDIPDGYSRNGNTYTSPDYDSAEHQIELSLSQAVGSLVVEER